MADTLGSDLGANADRNAVGKGIQQINLQLGDKPIGEVVDLLRRLQTAVYGDMEAGMAGLVRRLELIQEEVKELSTQMKTLQGKVGVMEEQLEHRGETSRAMLVLLCVITLLLLILIVAAIWGFFYLQRSGIRVATIYG